MQKRLMLQKNAAEMPGTILKYSRRIDEETAKKIIQVLHTPLTCVLIRKKAYKLRLTRINTNFSKYEVQEHKIKEAKAYYRPLITKPSKIIKDETVTTLILSSSSSHSLKKTSSRCFGIGYLEAIS